MKLTELQTYLPDLPQALTIADIFRHPQVAWCPNTEIVDVPDPLGQEVAPKIINLGITYRPGDGDIELQTGFTYETPEYSREYYLTISNGHYVINHFFQTSPNQLGEITLQDIEMPLTRDDIDALNAFWNHPHGRMIRRTPGLPDVLVEQYRKSYVAREDLQTFLADVADKKVPLTKYAEVLIDIELYDPALPFAAADELSRYLVTQMDLQNGWAEEQNDAGETCLTIRGWTIDANDPLIGQLVDLVRGWTNLKYVS